MPPAKINVGIGKIVYSRSGQILQAIGIGSCIAVICYEKKSGTCGMAHIMLPEDSSKTEGKPFRAANSAIPALIKGLTRRGADPKKLQSMLFGGATIFPVNGDKKSIGERNIQAVESQLQAANIKIVAKEVGGNIGRTIIFYPKEFKVVVSSIDREARHY